MFEQLSGAQERYQAINDRLMDPNVVSDPKQYAELMKEYKNLTPIVEKYCEYKKATEDMEEAKMMLEEGGLDKDFRELIEEQYETSKKDIEVISEQLKILLIPKDPNDDKNVIVEIRGGAGGDDVSLSLNVLLAAKQEVIPIKSISSAKYSRSSNISPNTSSPLLSFPLSKSSL